MIIVKKTSARGVEEALAQREGVGFMKDTHKIIGLTETAGG